MDYGGWEDRSGDISPKNRTSCGKEPKDERIQGECQPIGFSPGKHGKRESWVEKGGSTNRRRKELGL